MASNRVALRSLIATPAVDWALIQPALLRVLANPRLSSAIRAFSFGIIAFAVMQEKWGAQQRNAVEFLCRQFEAERDSRLALQQILALKLVLRYASEEASAAARQPLRQSILECLKQRVAMVPLPPELHQQLQQTRAAYPGQF
jgi:hypothetical protein